MKIQRPRPFLLLILDGWGYREENTTNAIALAHKPNWDNLWQTYPHTTISGSGHCVGLPHGQMGNSEVGHMNMGAGRIVYQDLTRIDDAIVNGDFLQNPILLAAIKQTKTTHRALHIMGLVSPGGVHSHENHLHALLKMLADHQVSNVYIHAFLDGRDTPPRSAGQSLANLQNTCDKLNCGQIVSIIGRYYAMDRDKRFERVEKAYNLLVKGKADYHADSADQALKLAYERGENDEFVQATSIHPPDAHPHHINEGDIVIFTNFRADRAREITEALTNPNFAGFVRQKYVKLGNFVCFAEYDSRFALPIAFPPQPLNQLLAEVISEHGLAQLRIAETEKYAHVTFFFNGGVEQPYPNEDRILIPSPKVATYDLQPEMSAPELTDRLVEEIRRGKYDVIIGNFANPDMVGHTGNLPAAIQAIETVDKCLGKIILALQEVGGEALITADHGNAEQMFDYQTNQPHTAHTSDPVPLIYVGRKAEISKFDGKLSDIAATILYLLNIPIPQAMTGRKLVELV